MYKNVFLRAGLTPTQSEILDFLYEKKESKASDIAKGIKKSRAIVYKDLDELVNFKIVERIDGTNQVSIFRIEHPSNIEKFFESRENKLKKDKELFNNYLPDLISSYNLMSNKPGVRFYEGIEGLKKTLDDTLNSKTDIYLFLNKEALQEEESFRDINESYKSKRERKGIKKKILRLGERPFHEPTTGKDYEKITEIKYFKDDSLPFKSSIQIYDNKISLQIFNQGKIISIIIENKHIYEMNKVWFDYLWKNSN